MYKNSEGYADPTAGLALSHMMKEYRQGQKRRYADKNRKKVYVASRYAGDVVNVNTHMYKKWNILMYNNGITHLLRESPEAHACL